MQKLLNQSLAFILATMMVISLLPSMRMTVFAVGNEIPVPTVAASDITETSATITITREDIAAEGNKYYYAFYSVQEKDEDPITAITIGDIDKYPFMQDSDFFMGNAKSASATVNDLEAGKEYVVYASVCYAVDNDFLFSDVVTAEFKTTAAEPEIPVPTVAASDITETSATITITREDIAAEGNKYYYAFYSVQEKDEDPITAITIGDIDKYPFMQDSDFFMGNAKSASATVNDLEAGKEYVVYVSVCYAVDNDFLFSNVATAEFKTAGGSSEIDEPTDGAWSLTYNNNGKVEKHYYENASDLTEILNNLSDSCDNVVITLEKDYTEKEVEEWSGALYITKSCTLDLNGHTFKVKVPNSMAMKTYGILVEGDIDFVLKDSSVSGKGTISANCLTTLAIGSSKLRTNVYDINFVMENGTVTNTSGGSGDTIFIKEKAKVIINNGVIHGNIGCQGDLTIEDGQFNTSESEFIVSDIYKTAKIKINGGAFKNTKNSSLASAVFLDGGYTDYNDSEPRIQILGGSFESTYGHAIYARHKGGADNVLISKNAKLVSENSSSIYIEAMNMDKRSGIYKYTIGDGAELTGKTADIELNSVTPKNFEKYSKGIDIHINEGTYVKYGDIPVYPNTTYVTYPDGMVLDTEPVAEGEHKGFYTLKASSEMSQTVGSQTFGYQYMNDLETAINGAKETYEAGNADGKYDDTMWSDFVKAYEEALPIPDDTNANQNEIDYFADRIISTYALIKNSEDNELDLNELADGTYNVDIEMWYWMPDDSGFRSYSMSNDAVEHNAKLTVKDGVPYLDVNFKPITVGSSYGSLMYYWVYDGTTPAESFASSKSGTNKVEAEYPAYMTVDSLNQTTSPIEGTPSEMPAMDNYVRPAVISIELPYIGASQHYNYIYSRVTVDAMGGPGKGEQNVILYIKYNTLTEISANPSIRLDKTELTMIAPEDSTAAETAEVTAKMALGTKQNGELTGVNSSDETVAKAVIDTETGVITITPVSEGEAEITVTGTASDKKDPSNVTNISNVIKVSVADPNAKPVKVDTTTITGKTVAAELTGNTLTTTEESVVVDTDSITVNAAAGTEADTAKVTVPQDAAKALANADKPVIFKTDAGEITLDATLMDVLAKQETATLTVSKTTAPADVLGKGGKVSFTGTNDTAYELSLSDVDFGSGKATVRIPFDGVSGYVYYINDGKIAERLTLTVDDGYASFTTDHFSSWVLSDHEYQVYEAGSEGDNTGNDFFLADGKYLVDIALWKAAADEVSMGNVAFESNNKALVTVKDGKITTVEIATSEVDVGTYHSAIITFKADGNDVTVLKTGTLVTQPAGKTYDYIKRASFEMPDSAQPTSGSEVTYVPVQFWVPDTPMDAAVGDTLDARIKFIWSSAESTDMESLEAKDNISEQSPEFDATDEATGLKVHANKGVFDEGIQLVVTLITSGDMFDKAKTALDGTSDKFTFYEIHFVDAEGNAVQPNGVVTVSYPIPSDYDSTALALYRINEDGTKTLVKGEAADGFYTVMQRSFSTYVLADISESPTDPDNTGDGDNTNPDNNGGNGDNTTPDNNSGNGDNTTPDSSDNSSAPRTGDSTGSALAAILMMLSAAGAAVFAGKRKKETGEK